MTSCSYRIARPRAPCIMDWKRSSRQPRALPSIADYIPTADHRIQAVRAVAPKRSSTMSKNFELLRASGHADILRPFEPRGQPPSLGRVGYERPMEQPRHDEPD